LLRRVGRKENAKGARETEKRVKGIEEAQKKAKEDEETVKKEGAAWQREKPKVRCVPPFRQNTVPTSITDEKWPGGAI